MNPAILHRTLHIALSAALILLVGCKSSKRSVEEPAPAPPSPQITIKGETGEIVTGSSSTDETASSGARERARKGKRSTVVERINQNRQTARSLRGKVDFSFQTGATPLTASATLKMKRDEIIQLSITALGLLEIGRMELTPEYIFIQDRYHKRYLKESWSSIPALQAAGIDFYAFQALFWNELYLPGSSAAPADKDFEQTDIGTQMRLQPKDGRTAADALFYTNADHTLLQQTSLIAKGGKQRFDATYGNWTQFNGKAFPANLRLHIQATNRGYQAEFTFTRLQVDESMGNITSSVTEGRYTRVSLDEILRGLHL